MLSKKRRCEESKKQDRGLKKQKPNPQSISSANIHSPTPIPRQKTKTGCVFKPIRVIKPKGLFEKPRAFKPVGAFKEKLKNLEILKNLKKLRKKKTALTFFR